MFQVRASSPKPTRPSSWLTKGQIAAVFDVSERYFDRDIRPFVRREHIRANGRKLRFYARGVIEAWADRRAARGGPEPNLGQLLLAAGLQ